MISLIADGSSRTVPVKITYSISTTTGDINYKIYRMLNGQSLVLTAHGSCGVPLAVSHYDNNYSSYVSGAVTAAAGVAVSTIVPNALPFMVGTIASSATTAIQASQQQHYMVSGGIGGFQNFEDSLQNFVVYSISYDISDSPQNVANTIGKPLFKKVPEIKQLTGFAQFQAAYIEGGKYQEYPPTQTELDIIQQYLMGGVYIQ